MIKNLEHISETKKRLTVEIPADVIEERIRQELVDIGRQTKIPGFRPGRAPVSLLEKRFGDSVAAEVINKIVPEYYVKAMNEAKLSPVTHPEFEEQKHERKSPLEMTFTVEVLPEIKDLKYEGIRVSAEEPEVTDEDIQTALRRIQAERLTYENVDRAVEDGDVVTFDAEVVEDGKELKGQVFKVGTDQFPREFSEALKGKAAGDAFEAEITFPEDHPSEFRGRKVTFRGEIKEVKVLRLPDIDDGFAKEAGYESLAALKDSLRADIAVARQTQIKKKKIVELIEKLIEMHDFPVPESMLENELSSLLTSARMKEENKDKDDQTLREELKAEAEKSAKAAVLLNVIGNREDITVTDEEMKEKLLELSQMTNIPPQNLVQMYMSKDGSLEGLRYGVFKEKVGELIYSKAVFEKGD